MGWCSEFGIEIAACDHPMVAGAGACHCEICGARCEGRFDGCSDVWAQGPVQVELVRRGPTRAPRYGSRSGRSVPDSSSTNGESRGTPSVRDLDGIREVRMSLQRLEGRLDMLEISVARMLDALVAREVSSNGTRADAATGDPDPGQHHAAG